jgi:hypothetical protein
LVLSGKGPRLNTFIVQQVQINIRHQHIVSSLKA